jgi:hypothetical protein
LDVDVGSVIVLSFEAEVGVIFASAQGLEDAAESSGAETGVGTVEALAAMLRAPDLGVVSIVEAERGV